MIIPKIAIIEARHLAQEDIMAFFAPTAQLLQELPVGLETE
jgi:hypothetical protein